MEKKKKKVLLIGWDAADWKFINPLIEAGKMPHLKKLIEGGTSGKLATLDPPLSPTLWTSIATGKRPYKHGIHGFVEPDPSGEGIRPIYITNRKVKAIWNILSQHQLKSNVIGWWPSHPAEPINGVMVSNFYQRASKPYGENWPMVKGTVHPESLSETFANLRIHPGELTEAHVLPFVPEAWKIDQRVDKRLKSLTKIIADCSTIHAATTYTLDHTEWDFTAVYLDAIDHFCHGFMKYHPPHRPHIPKKDFDLYKDVVNGGCIYHDMMLGTLMKSVDEDTVVMLISDHGFHPDHNRPVAIPKEPAGPAVEHSPYGVIVMNGPGIKKDGLIFGSSLLDITPTILSIFGLPVAEDMDGKVLTNAFEETPNIETINSWENIKGADGTHSEAVTQTKEELNEELQQLIDLGYIDDVGDDVDAAVKSVKDENDYYLARSYIDGQKWKEGIEILERLHKDNPTSSRYGIRLANAYQGLGKLKAARQVIDHVRTHHDRESPKLDLLEGNLLIAEERYQKALDLFQKVEKEAGTNAQVKLQIANAYLKLNRHDDALISTQNILEFDNENVYAYHTLGVCFYRLGRYEEAVEAFLQAIGLLYYLPTAHFHLGESLMALERYEDAAEAFETCSKLAPGMNVVRQRLISIYEQFLNLPGKALKYKTDILDKVQGTITIVSGLPRSGTSMMMQMLEAGGMEVFTDKIRTPDESNPKGYYEHEAVKSIKTSKVFLKGATDKVVKVIAQSLVHLPMSFQYRIVFMERNVMEVIASQQKMLHRGGKKVDLESLPINLINQYEKTLKKVKVWANNLPNVDIHFVDYSSIIESPFLQSMLVNDFFDGNLTVENMASAVEGKLYREKIKSPNDIAK